MTNSTDQVLPSMSAQEDLPTTVETFADVLKLHGVESLNVDADIQRLAIRATNELLLVYGPEWVKENSAKLIQELKRLSRM